MMNKENEAVGAKNFLELTNLIFFVCFFSFFKLSFMQSKNVLFLGQVLGRWTIFGVWFWPMGLFPGITICLHWHIPVTIIPKYRPGVSGLLHDNM